MPLPVCKVIATGGTIAMKRDAHSGAPVPAISGEDLVATVPELQQLARIEVENLDNVASAYMDPPRWQALQQAVAAALAQPEVAGVIVTHGTDTLEETGFFLDLTIDSPKPVVLTGAQRSASEPDFDGPRNLLNAVRICLCDEARDKGVMIALNGQINAAREVAKTHTSAVEAFQSGAHGLLGVADHDRVRFYRSPTRRLHLPLRAEPLPAVEIVAMYGGADGSLLRAALAGGARGVVIQALGWGNVNQPMYRAVREALAQGVAVVISTRVPRGRTLPVYGFEGGGRTLQAAGAVFADDLSPQKARLLLILALQQDLSAGELQTLFDR